MFSWAERLFGPLGRSAAQMRLSSFKPDAWMVDLPGADPDPEGGTPTDREPAPAGWSVWDASAEEIPAEMNLTIWHMAKFRTLAWIVCLGCLSLGLALAQLAPRIARRIGLFTLATAAALAVAAPLPYCALGGSMCVGNAGRALAVATVDENCRAAERKAIATSGEHGELRIEDRQRPAGAGGSGDDGRLRAGGTAARASHCPKRRSRRAMYAVRPRRPIMNYSS